MNNIPLIIGNDSRISKYIKHSFKKKKIKFISTSRRKKKLSKNILFLKLQKHNNFSIPANVSTAIILAGIDGEKNCTAKFKEAKKISENFIPKLIYRLLKKKIFVCYISTMSIYKKNSLYGNLRLLAEKSIYDKIKKNYNFRKRFCIIRPTKNLRKIIEKKNLKIIKSNDNFFRPVRFTDTAEIILKKIEKRKNGIFNLVGRKKIYFKIKNKKSIKNIKYKNNFKILKPNHTYTV